MDCRRGGGACAQQAGSGICIPPHDGHLGERPSRLQPAETLVCCVDTIETWRRAQREPEYTRSTPTSAQLPVCSFSQHASRHISADMSPCRDTLMPSAARRSSAATALPPQASRSASSGSKPIRNRCASRFFFSGSIRIISNTDEHLVASFGVCCRHAVPS